MITEKNRYILIGLAIKEARVEKGLTKKELAKKIQKTAHCLGLWEKGTRRISIEHLEKIASVLDKPISYFLNFTEVEKINNAENFMILVKSSINDLSKKGFPLFCEIDSKEQIKIKNIGRLWTKIIKDSGDLDINIEFDFKLGAVENEKQLSEYLIKNHLIKGK